MAATSTLSTTRRTDRVMRRNGSAGALVTSADRAQNRVMPSGPRGGDRGPWGEGHERRSEHVRRMPSDRSPDARRPDPGYGPPVSDEGGFEPGGTGWSDSTWPGAAAPRG